MPYYIDFSADVRGADAVFDFIKRRSALRDWNLAARPAGERCPAHWPTLVRLMRELTSPKNRFPALLRAAALFGGGGAAGGRGWPSFTNASAGCGCWPGSIAPPAGGRRRTTSGRLCLYARPARCWTDPRKTERPEEKAAFARRGVFLTVLSGLLLEQGLTGVSAARSTFE